MKYILRIPKPNFVLVPIEESENFPYRWQVKNFPSLIKEDYYRGLAYAYEPHPQDISQEWVSNDPPTKKVIRKIISSFWSIREILPYGGDYQVQSPPELRDRIKQQFAEALQQYA
jgi:hypothetical protein